MGAEAGGDNAVVHSNGDGAGSVGRIGEGGEESEESGGGRGLHGDGGRGGVGEQPTNQQTNELPPERPQPWSSADDARTGTGTGTGTGTDTARSPSRWHPSPVHDKVSRRSNSSIMAQTVVSSCLF
jgi:hypothetical protein